MEPQIRPSDRVAVVGSIDPQSSSTNKTSGWVDATTFHNYMALLAVGTMGASATLDAKIQQATSSGGANVKDVTGKAITQLTQAGGNASQQIAINVRQEDLDIANGFKWIRLSMTPATAACLIFGAVLGVDPRNLPAGSNAAASQIQVP